jgi:hypothetical protein
LSLYDSKRPESGQHRRLNLYVIRCREGAVVGAPRPEYLVAPSVVISAEEEICAARFPTVTHCARILLKYPRESFSAHIVCYQPAANDGQFRCRTRHDWVAALVALVALILLLVLIEEGSRTAASDSEGRQEKTCLIRDCQWLPWYRLPVPSEREELL